MIFDLLEEECVAHITRISSLLVFYKFELSPSNKLLYDICREQFALYRHVYRENLIKVYFTLFGIEEKLITDITEILEPYIENEERYHRSIWTVWPLERTWAPLRLSNYENSFSYFY